MQEAAGASLIQDTVLHSVNVAGVIYSTLGTLVAVATYDLLRFAFPRRWFATLWRYEHVVKMIGAYSATLSAFAGTVLGGLQPYSQLLPSVVCTAIMIFFLMRLRPQGLAGSLESAVRESN